MKKIKLIQIIIIKNNYMMKIPIQNRTKEKETSMIYIKLIKLNLFLKIIKRKIINIYIH